MAHEKQQQTGQLAELPAVMIQQIMTQTLQQKHRQHSVQDIATIFWCAASGLDYQRYAQWLSEWRRINIEELPRNALKKENLDVLFKRKVTDRFLAIYTAAETEKYTLDDPEALHAVENYIVQDTRPAIEAALNYLKDEGNLNRVRISATLQIDPGMLAMNIPVPATKEEELQARVKARLTLG